MPVEQLPATAVVPDAVTVASDDPAQAEIAEMAERYLQKKYVVFGRNETKRE